MTPPLVSPSPYTLRHIQEAKPIPTDKYAAVPTPWGKDAAVCYVVDVPIALDLYQKPVLKPLLRALHEVGKLLCPGDLVLFQQALYPGFLAEVCLPTLEQASHKKSQRDFFVAFVSGLSQTTGPLLIYSPNVQITDSLLTVWESHAPLREVKSFATLREAEAAHVKAVCEQYVLCQWHRESHRFFEALGVETEALYPTPRSLFPPTTPAEVAYAYKASKKIGRYLRLLAGSLEV